MTSTLNINRPWALPDARQILPWSASRIDREGWLAARRKLMCASDIANLFGVGYGDEYTVWAEKLNLVPSYTSDAQARGLHFEDAVIDLWLDRHVEFPIVTRRAGLMQSKLYRRAGCTPDRISVCELGRCHIQAKTTTSLAEWGTDDDPLIPTGYQLQGQWEIFVSGRDHVHFVAAGPRFQIVHRILPRDDELIAVIARRVAEWVGRHIVAGVQPEATAKSADVVKQLYGDPVEGKEYVLSDEESAVLETVLGQRALIDQLQGEVDDNLAMLQARIGEATEVRWPNGRLAATWRPSTIVGADKDWRQAHPQAVEKYGYMKRIPAVDVNQMAKDLGGLPPGLRRKRTFNFKLPQIAEVTP